MALNLTKMELDQVTARVFLDQVNQVWAMETKLSTPTQLHQTLGLQALLAPLHQPTSLVLRSHMVHHRVLFYQELPLLVKVPMLSRVELTPML